MTNEDKARFFLSHPVALGHQLGYPDLREDLHGQWLNAIINENGDKTIQAHRNSYKTTCLSVGLALRMLKYRDQNIIFMRKTDTDVVEVVNNVRRILNSPLMIDIYSALTGNRLSLIKDNSTELSASCYTAPIGAAQLLGIGIGGSLTGKHADVIVTDDIVNLKDRQSRAERERTKAIYQELQNVKKQGGRIINTGTPWHKDDAFTLMPEPVKFDCYSTGLMTEEQIEAMRQQMAPSLFAANYELRHIASENAMFTTYPKEFTDVQLLRDGIAHVDAAYGGDDYTAFTCARRRGNKIYLYGKLWQSHIDTVLDVVISESRRLMCAPIHVELNGDKGYLSREIRNRGYSAYGYTEDQNKHIKISTYLRKWWGNIEFLKGTDRDYIAQIMDYTDVAEHDDAPDSAACCCRYWDRR